ncbi:MAG: CPBP family intramembrane metalloprotease [Lachnospiraceae bacterium]|nr:CPBP family intramembrane metalloprotease [Lachnospiraceae bacterium]
MEEKKAVKGVNLSFLCMMILYLLIAFLTSLIEVAGFSPNVIVTLIMGEVVVLIPALIFVLIKSEDIRRYLPMRKLKPATVGLSFLFGICIMPSVQWLNIVSQLFTKNLVSDTMLKLIDDISPVAMIITVALIGPLCEEIAFRGVIFGGLRRSGRILGAVIVSALFFGLMHLNLNQFIYAFVLGVAFALLTEATGSILPSFIGHFVINGYNIVTPYIAEYFLQRLGNKGSDILNEAMESSVGKLEILIAAGVYLIPAVIGAVLSVLLFMAICRQEGSLSHIKKILKLVKDTDEQGETERENMAVQRQIPLITASGYVAIAICTLIILLAAAASKVFGLLFG